MTYEEAFKKTYYELLEIPTNAPPRDIKRARAKLALSDGARDRMREGGLVPTFELAAHPRPLPATSRDLPFMTSECT